MDNSNGKRSGRNAEGDRNVGHDRGAYQVPATDSMSHQNWHLADGLCQWFLACDNPADGTVHHLVLGNVPTCQRCADKLDLDLVKYPTEGRTQ